MLLLLGCLLDTAGPSRWLHLCAQHLLLCLGTSRLQRACLLLLTTCRRCCHICCCWPRLGPCCCCCWHVVRPSGVFLQLMRCRLACSCTSPAMHGACTAQLRQHCRDSCPRGLSLLTPLIVLASITVLLLPTNGPVAYAR